MDSAIKVDDLTLACSIAELGLYSAGAILFFPAFYMTVRVETLHSNFRAMLSMILVRTPISSVRRLVMVYTRVFITGESPVVWQATYNKFTNFGWWLLCISMILLTLERTLATFAVDSCLYTSNIGRCEHLLNAFLILLTILLSATGALVGVTEFTRWFMTGTMIATGLMVLILYRVNTRRRRMRIATDTLTVKSNTVGNIRSFDVYYPLMISECIFMLVTVSVALYQKIATTMPIGFDLGKINNIYGLLTGLDTLIAPIITMIRLRKVKAIAMQKTAETAAAETNATEAYQRQYAQLWGTPLPTSTRGDHYQ